MELETHLGMATDMDSWQPRTLKRVLDWKRAALVDLCRPRLCTLKGLAELKSTCG
jgi:hypothetical protein